MTRSMLLVFVLAALPCAAAEPAYSWRVRDDDPDRIYLYRDGTQVGGWCYRTRQYRPYDGMNWGAPTSAAPVPAPEKPAVNVQIMPGPSYIRPQPQPRLLRPFRSAVDAAMQKIVEESINKLIGEAIPNALKSAKWEWDFGLYLVDVNMSARLFCYLETGGKIGVDPAGNEQKIARELMTRGCAHIFMDEKRKFAEALAKEGFSNIALTSMTAEIYDHIVRGPMEISAPQTMRVYRAGNWLDESPASRNSDGPFVLLTTSVRTRDPAIKTPVTVQCAMNFTAVRDGKSVPKSLSLVLFLDSLDKTSGWYVWKVGNVAYK